MGESVNMAGVLKKNLKIEGKITKMKSLAMWDSSVSSHDEPGHAAWRTR